MAVRGEFWGMAKPGVVVRGEGIAAVCCEHLLRMRGCRVATDGGGFAKWVASPTILVSQSTQKLLADIFESKDLFDGLPEIRKRVVAWDGGQSEALPHSAVVAPAGMLLDRLRARLTDTGVRTSGEDGDRADWTIVTDRAPKDSAEEMHFGSRMALVSEVELAQAAEQDACWAEAGEQGWLFLLATGAGKASLICVGGGAKELLAKSRLVGPQVSELGESLGEFAAYPRTTAYLCGARWLACGSAAMTFDPLCGEGAGNAAREAILACATMRAIAAGESSEELLREYSWRLRMGFLRHLENCREFYRREGTGAFWASELELLERGIVWTREKIRGLGRPRFRLVGFDLERVAYEETT
jgi:hypothetical protein